MSRLIGKWNVMKWNVMEWNAIERIEIYRSHVTIGVPYHSTTFHDNYQKDDEGGFLRPFNSI